MHVVSQKIKDERGWYYIGKIKWFKKPCNFCGTVYEKPDAQFYCSKSCMRLDKPLRMFGEDNPSKRPEVRAKIVAANTGRTLSIEHCEKISASLQGLFGKLSRRWKGGGNLHQKYRGRTEWKQWRKFIFHRDGYKCLDCGLGGRLEPHHIVPLRVAEDKVFDVNNGITLCRKCHINTFGKEMSLVNIYKSLIPKCN